MKNEACGYENCRFSRINNHIHCIRTNCNYVLHSSGQLLSHKRKHERKDSELAYRKFKLSQSMMKSLQEGVPISFEQVGRGKARIEESRVEGSGARRKTAVEAIRDHLIDFCDLLIDSDPKLFSLYILIYIYIFFCLCDSTNSWKPPPWICLR